MFHRFLFYKRSETESYVVKVSWYYWLALKKGTSECCKHFINSYRPFANKSPPYVIGVMFLISSKEFALPELTNEAMVKK
jgi:hypothetical protein